MNIRVLNLSFGTDGVQDYRIDPLAYAAEVAWHKGIVVVVASGNEGFGSAQLNNPAYDPYVLAVGASDMKGTLDRGDDKLAEFSSRGTMLRRADLIAPGRSIIGLRAPGSYIDEQYPAARVGERFFKGSGTSQSAAVVSGAAALLLQQRPELNPDQVKRLLINTANRLPSEDLLVQGSGQLDLAQALTKHAPLTMQAWPLATGLGSLELARGSVHLEEEGVELRGEQDIMGSPWDGRTWSHNAWEGRTWSGGDWNGRTWSGDCWCATSWSGRTWSGRTWSGRTWSGRTWSGRTWSGRTWSGRTWSGGDWIGNFLGRTWSGNIWSGSLWGE